MSIIRLITWFERFCELYPAVLALGYGAGSKTQVAEFHRIYLLTLLARIDHWSQFEKNMLSERVKEATGRLKDALDLVGI